MIIAHISDIHIRRNKRHEEYRVVLSNLISSLESFSIDRIVVAGDVIHNKRELSPELIQLTVDYLDGLSDVAPVDLILGNHDWVINQYNRLDSLSPIVTLLKEKGKPIHLYKESGLHEVTGGLVYGVFAQQDSEELWPIDFDREDEKTYVALYHGAVHGSRTSGSYRIESDINKSVFSNYDFGMLGDIHSRQPMLLDEQGKIKVAYSGSLVQQNFGEDTEKGFLLWDTDVKKCTFIQVANEWGFKTFRLDADAINNIDNIDFDLPAKPYVRILIRSDDYNITTANHIESLIKRKYKTDHVFIEVDANESIDDLSLSDTPENVTDIKTQQDLLRQYFAKRPTISEEEVNEVLDIHKDFYDTCSTEEYETYKGRKWTIHKVIFDNVFSYGPSNVINFDKMKGLTGIFSPNASGKSSILYTILQGFFNNSNRTGGRNIADVIHKNKTEGIIEIEFSVDNQKYVIERKFKRNKRHPNRATNKVVLFQYIEGEKVDISGEANVRETENAIRSLLGSYEEHTMTTFSQQFDVTRFIDHGQTNRKDLLSRFLGLNVIDDLQKSIRDETASIKSVLKEYQQNDYPSILSQFEERREETVDKLNELKVEKETLEKSTGERRKKKDVFTKSLHSIHNGLRPLSSIESDIEKSSRSIEKLEDRLEVEKKTNSNTLSGIEYRNNLIDEYKSEGFEENREKFYRYKEELNKLTAVQKVQQQVYKTKQNQISILDKHDWFETNDLCKKCSFLTGAFAAKKELDVEGADLHDLNIEIDFLSHAIGDFDISKADKYDEYVEDAKSLELKLENSNITLQNIKLQWELEGNKLSSYEKEREDNRNNEHSIQHNNRVEFEIKKIDSELARLDAAISVNNNEFTKSNSYLGQISQKIIDLGGNIEVLKEIEKKYNTHTLLMEAFGSDGIPLMIMNRAVPIINNEIKKILSNITNFEVFLEVDTEAHDLSIFIDDGTSRRRIELGSGMEKTLAALVVRSALSNISLLPTCNLFIIDEGFGTLDSENINHMNQLLGYLKSKFENVLIISHIEGMQDITNNVINIHKNEKGYSSIKIL